MHKTTSIDYHILYILASLWFKYESMVSVIYVISTSTDSPIKENIPLLLTQETQIESNITSPMALCRLLILLQTYPKHIRERETIRRNKIIKVEHDVKKVMEIEEVKQTTLGIIEISLSARFAQNLGILPQQSTNLRFSSNKFTYIL